MLKDWSNQRPVTSASRIQMFVKVIIFGSLSCGLLYLGVWLGESRQNHVQQKQNLSLRPLTLGETRFKWRGEPLNDLPSSQAILPPIHDPVIPNRPTRIVAVEQSSTSDLVPPSSPSNSNRKLSLAQSLDLNPVHANHDEHMKVERERAELEKAELEKAELEKAELEKAELEKAEREKAEREKAEREKAEREKAEREKAELEKTERERAEQSVKQVTQKQNQATPNSSNTQELNLQVKAFRQRAEAVHFVTMISSQLTEYSEQIYIQSAESKGHPIYRVRIGPFSDQPAADAARLLYIKRFGTVDAPFISHR